MFKKIIAVLLLTSTSLLAQSWGISISNIQTSNNNCYGHNYYIQQVPVITYMPQNIYMRPYQSMPVPQPIIINSYPAFTPIIPFTPSVIYNQNKNCYR